MKLLPRRAHGTDSVTGPLQLRQWNRRTGPRIRTLRLQIPRWRQSRSRTECGTLLGRDLPQHGQVKRRCRGRTWRTRSSPSNSKATTQRPWRLSRMLNSVVTRTDGSFPVRSTRRVPIKTARRSRCATSMLFGPNARTRGDGLSLACEAVSPSSVSTSVLHLV